MPPEEIETLASEVIYRNRWMTLREDRIRRQDGSEGIYGVVEKADFAVIAAIQDGRIHLVQQYRYPVCTRCWELPQGNWEGTAPEPEVLAAAELREETGLEAGHLEHIAKLHLAYGFCTQAYHVFLATDLKKGELQLDPEEIGLITEDFPISEVKAMILKGEITDATTVAVIGLLEMHGKLK